MFNLVAYTTGVLTLIFLHVNALDIESAKESPCFSINTVPVDANWILSTRIWYYPIASRYDLYHVGTDLSGRNPNEIREDEVYYDMCMTFWFGVGKFYVKGFKMTQSYSVNPVRGLEEYTWRGDNNEAEMMTPYTTYTTLTDNKTFILVSSCLDGQMSFAVSSTMKRLPEETTKLIYDHAISLGFKREHFTAVRYDSCEKGFEGNEEISDDEL